MSQKRIDAGPHIHSLIAERWSPRAFAERDVEPEKLRACLEAARWAPSCYNEQPWYFIVGRRGEGETYGRVFDCLVEQNQRWAGTAPVLMISVAKPTFDFDGRSNRHAPHDVGLATMALMLQATGLGMAAHGMAGFSRKKAHETFGIPEEHDPMAAVALGYPGEADTLPEDLAEKERAPRDRRPLADWVFGETWGKTAEIVS
jgi:nitroreductase